MKKLSALTLILLVNCTFLQDVQDSLFTSEQVRSNEEKAPLPAGRKPIRILPMQFKNSAQMESVNFVSNETYDSTVDSIIREKEDQPESSETEKQESDQDEQTTEKAAKKETDKNTENQSSVAKVYDPDEVKSGPAEPPVPVVEGEQTGTFDGGLILQEIFKTEMIQSDRFEVVDPQLTGLKNTDELPPAEYIEKHNIDYLLYADLTSFEVEKSSQYWKIPLWAILLVAAVVVDDDDFRAFVLEGLLRLWLYLPSDSPFWELGAGVENMELVINLGIDLRLVDPKSGSVVYVKEQQIDRIEEVGNLDLIVWGTQNQLSIKQSSAGKQIRVLALEMLNAMEAKVDNGSLPPRRQR